MTKRILVPLKPTKRMLAAMTEATFLSDGSHLEMERRFNGLIQAVKDERKEQRKKK